MRLNQIITIIYMAQEALGFMQNSKEKNLDFIEILSKEPDNILSLDVSSVKTLQIGYQAETLLLHKADDDTLTIKEYINGLSGSEYYAKVTANRFKTTIRYGRRETVNPATCIEIFLPEYHYRCRLECRTICCRDNRRFYFFKYDHCSTNPACFFNQFNSHYTSRGIYGYTLCFWYNYR